ncbi:hypothetical protein EV126DRAFT_107821 [Verticillium dahliae]|nr:hypothetical protein EV126DRAFT_107821 [Verticillium dahliae]
MEAAVQRQHRLRASAAPERQTRAITTNGAQENTAATNSNRPQPCGISLLYSYQQKPPPHKASRIFATLSSPSSSSWPPTSRSVSSEFPIAPINLAAVFRLSPNPYQAPAIMKAKGKKKEDEIKKTDTARFNDEGAKMGGERVQQTGVQNEEEPAQPAARKQPCLQGIGIGRLHCVFFFPGVIPSIGLSGRRTAQTASSHHARKRRGKRSKRMGLHASILPSWPV